MPSDPGPTSWLDRAGRQVEAGDWAGALLTAEETIAGRPDLAPAWTLRGVALAAMGRTAEAVESFEQATTRDPGDPEPLDNLLRLQMNRRDWPAVRDLAGRLLVLRPGDAEPHRALAMAAAASGARDVAQARLGQAVSLAPRHVEAWLDLIGLVSPADPAAAVEAAGAALAANPGDARLAARQSEMVAAVALQQALAAAPDDVGLVRQRVDLALQRLSQRQAVGWSPLHAEGLELQGAHDAIIAALDAGLAPRTLPWSATPILARLMAWEALERVRPFAMADGPADPRDLMMKLSRVEATRPARLELLRQHRLWGEGVEAATGPLPPRPERGAGERIRLGVLSSDLRDHPVGAFAWPLFEHLDRDRFDLSVYSSFQGPPDAGEAAFAERATAYRRLPPDLAQAAEVIAADGLDVLIEIGGLTGANRPELLARRLAPIQVSWLGYPHSIGLSNVDYMLLDPYLVPASAELLLEKPLLMPSSWITLGGRAFRDEPRPAGAPPVGRNGYVTFGSANASYKYSPACLDAWARVLAAVPGSRFLVARPEADAPIFRTRMLEAFARRGVAAERIGFEAVRGGHLPFYDRIDISLDTLPLTGGTTTCESLWMGAPVVSLVGAAVYERLSYSILANAGLDDLAATSLEGYVETATALAADRLRLERLRMGLRDQIKSGVLGRPDLFARQFYDLMAATVAAAR